MIDVKFEPLAGNALTAEALALLETKLHVNMTPQFKILRRKVVESGKPAEITLKKLQNVTKSYEVFMKKVTHESQIYTSVSNQLIIFAYNECRDWLRTLKRRFARPLISGLTKRKYLIVYVFYCVQNYL